MLATQTSGTTGRPDMLAPRAQPSCRMAAAPRRVLHPTAEPRSDFGYRISDFRSALLWLALAAASALCSSARAGDYNLDTDYQNYWFSPNPANGPFTNYFSPGLTNASTAVYGGHVRGNTNAVLPVGGLFGAEWSAHSQPVASLRADVALGSVIAAPLGTDTTRPPANFVPVKVGKNPVAYYECTDPPGGAFWVPSTGQVIAAQPNNLTVDWITLAGTTNRQVLNVSAVPLKRPARLFWTESPYDAPEVSLQGLFPAIHSNSEVPPPVLDIVTNVNGGVTNVVTNYLAGVWIDAQKQLHATEVSGLFVIEYYQEGTYEQQVQPQGIEVVQVLKPDLQIVAADVGARLLPLDTYWANVDGINGILPNVTQGLNETAYVYGQTGPKNNWAFAIKRTWMEPWALEVYWQHKGRMGVLWPYEVDWYSCDWPAHPQLLVLGDTPTDQPPALIPTELSAALMEDMDPPLHANLSASGRSLSTTQPGTCLLKYTTHDDLWFEVVQTVSHTNRVYFDLEPKDWPVGQELVPGGQEVHALRFDGDNDYLLVGQSFLNRLSDWTLSLWFDPAVLTNGTLYSEGGPLVTMSVDLTAAGQLRVGVWNRTQTGSSWWTRLTTTNALVQSNHWQQLTVTLTGATDTNGTLRLYLDDQNWEATNFYRVNFNSPTPQAVVAASSSSPAPNNFFLGKLDELRIWNVALTADQIRSNRYDVWPDTAGYLIASFPCDEGQGTVVHNGAGDKDGSLYGEVVWCWGQVLPGGDWPGFPGYVHVVPGDPTQGDRYNVNRYQYPNEAAPDSASHLFAVNTGQLEVWWANRSRQADMPAVYYPSRVARYDNVWPKNPPQIVIASGLGSNGDQSTMADEALSFDGINDSVDFGSDNRLALSGGAFTLEASIRPAGKTGLSTILARKNGGSANPGYAFHVNSWNTADGRLKFETQGQNAGTVDPVITWDVWQHVACTWDGTALRFYVNGAEKPASGRVNLTDGGLRATLGSFSDGASPYAGQMGEVRVWNVARTGADLSAAMHTCLRGEEDGLVASYPFAKGDDPAALADAGPGSLSGVIAGATWTAPGRPLTTPPPFVPGAPSIYAQNDPTQAGYNPNEEHALILGGVAYALRNDLNTTHSSEPYVLLDYLDPDTARPAMKAFSVVATNHLYRFERDLNAGLPILPLMPLGAMPLCTSNYSQTQPPAWRDRKLGWWAVSAGDDGGTADAVMRFYYRMQPTFCFPGLASNEQPAVGTEVPWLPDPSDPEYNHGEGGTPVAVTYRITWPDNLPELQLGQTLTVATRGLPDVWNQLSVDVVYDQSSQLGLGDSVTLFDPVQDQEADLDRAVIDAMLQSQLARQELTSPLIRFPTLPPSIYPRLFFDPNRGTSGQLVLEGQYVSTLTGSGYLLLNLLENFEKNRAQDAAQGIDPALKTKWDAAVTALPGDLTLIATDTPYTKAALGARLTSGVGCVTLAFNNSTNANQVAPALPVSLTLIKVVPELYNGELEVVEPDDALAEQLSLRYSADFAGQVEETEYQWRWVEPSGGLIPNTDFGTWAVYGSDPTPGTNEVTISGASPFTLSDHYFAVRYRPTAGTGPTGTNWSAWTYNLAPGWVKRAMTGINPFEQAFHDRIANAVDTRVTMISQAGGPYEGDVALNLDAASSAGLIATYQTIFNRAKAFSLESGLSDPGVNQTLLFAASRLHDLYSLLGNEAYADAQDPTIAFPNSLSQDQHGGDATAIFPFMNQVPNLLDEELALLRGRDDTLEPSVHTSPIYNRLIWNFTRGINGGEAAYAYNYNLRGTPTNTVGLITAEDAKRFYPQGHGDAWGHYLSAISPYYDLLAYTNFVWQTEPEATLLGDAPVSTDYLDEQKFAETAAARARTGAEIVKQTFRQHYSEDPAGRWPGYTDATTNRAWGVGEWASRAGQAALYDWAVANSLMLDSLTNMVQVGGSDRPPEGLEQIDRASTPELEEITRTFTAIQSQLDSADAGLNPLGLARNVVPFDIDPAAIDAGQTHFEQIYDRALQALYNACVAFDHARNATLQLREQSDSTAELEEALAENEIDYHNRLLELYGYPYPDDIGPTGTYPQGYEGPDLINWQILDLEDFMVNAPTGQVMQVTLEGLAFTTPTNAHWYSTDYMDYLTDGDRTTPLGPPTGSTNTLTTVTVSMADNGLKVKPSGWTGRRPAQGELQLALGDFVETWYSLEGKMAEYDQTLAELENEIGRRVWDYTRYTNEWQRVDEELEHRKETARILEGLKITKTTIELITDGAKELTYRLSDVLPKESEGLVGPFPFAGGHEDPGAGLRVMATTIAYVKYAIAQGFELGMEARRLQQEQWDVDLEKLLKGYEYMEHLLWAPRETEVKLKEQYVKRAELLAEVEALGQSQERVNKLLTEGERLIFERGQTRARGAQRIQTQRYADLSFRIFRNDALRRYQTAFDLAARYTYLAAKAYDYETGLLDSDTARTPGSRFLADVVRARLPGRFYVWLGTPMAGGATGEPGLADILARMKADWDVVKGRFGFNNPDTETSRFSLRSELFRISPSSNSDATWAQALEHCRVANLHDQPEFIRYCRPFIDTTNVEPALVIRFSTVVVARKNYFGHDMGGGDNAYDASHAVTKIRSVGVWFTGYNVTFNTNTTGPGLGNTPRVYLIPIGQDVMRSPTHNAVETRSWTVFDQAIPLPYSVGQGEVDDPDWIPVMHSLREPLAQLRRFASFRAYHDRGQFDEAETHNKSRLVGRSVWNTSWLLIIPGSALLADPEEGIERFVHGALVNSARDGNGIKDIKLFFQTYSISGD